VPADAGFLCDTAVVLGETIKGTHLYVPGTLSQALARAVLSCHTEHLSTFLAPSLKHLQALSCPVTLNSHSFSNVTQYEPSAYSAFHIRFKSHCALFRNITFSLI
jgi:hypothetical protein